MAENEWFQRYCRYFTSRYIRKFISQVGRENKKYHRVGIFNFKFGVNFNIKAFLNSLRERIQARSLDHNFCHNMIPTSMLCRRYAPSLLRKAKTIKFNKKWLPARCLSTQLQDRNKPEVSNAFGTVTYNFNSDPQHSKVKSEHLQKDPIRTSLLMELTDGIGILHEVLRLFWKYDVNVTRIESRPSQLGKFDFFVDLEGSLGDDNVDMLLASLKTFGVQKMLILDEKEGNLPSAHVEIHNMC